MIKYSEKYTEYFNENYLMGPNSIRLLDELFIKYPLGFSKDKVILDLGCGKGLTSLFIARETGASVYANDLWIEAEENNQRFLEWNVGDCITASHEDANYLSFDKEMFDVIISVDSYHYFAGKENFFQENIFPYVKKGGIVLIAIPGIREAYEGQQQELLGNWVGDECDMFHSCNWWRNMMGESKETEFVHTWEMENFSIAWQEWIATNNQYALGDKEHYETVIKKYTTFVGIAVKKDENGGFDELRGNKIEMHDESNYNAKKRV